MELYEIAFAGELVPGAQPELVKANLAKLFQADAQRMALLFSGRKIVIKSNLDEATAEKYRSTLARAGAIAIVQALEAVVEEIELAPPPAAPAPVVTAVAAVVPDSVGFKPLKVAPRDEYMAAFIDVEAPDFGVAPIGVDLQDARPAAQPPAVDFSQFSLAPVGSDMGQATSNAQAVAPDTSHLSLQ
ncbi:hypothetical protein [Pseudomonas sp. LRF_L74]|uniref:hypothetical protein n=1 Tax=Pseudomonas sp. LRF_L74 TaxID=3369422 RepID=UPI003F6110CF